MICFFCWDWTGYYLTPEESKESIINYKHTERVITNTAQKILDDQENPLNSCGICCVVYIGSYGACVASYKKAVLGCISCFLGPILCCPELLPDCVKLVVCCIANSAYHANIQPLLVPIPFCLLGLCISKTCCKKAADRNPPERVRNAEVDEKNKVQVSSVPVDNKVENL
jgi:hypothetical protein